MQIFGLRSFAPAPSGRGARKLFKKWCKSFKITSQLPMGGWHINGEYKILEVRTHRRETSLPQKNQYWKRQMALHAKFHKNSILGIQNLHSYIKLITTCDRFSFLSRIEMCSFLYYSLFFSYYLFSI